MGEVTTATIATIPKKHNSNNVSVHQWIRFAVHASRQLTSPIVPYLWNLRRCLVRYYWYQWSKEVGKQYFRVTNDFYLMELTMMKGGARVRLDLDEGWCEPLHYMTIQSDEGWCASETWPWWRVVWAFALHDNTAEKNWPWWRVVWDFTLHNNTSEKNWPWWRVVWDFTLHDNTSGKNLLWWRVVVRLYST